VRTAKLSGRGMGVKGRSRQATNSKQAVARGYRERRIERKAVREAFTAATGVASSLGSLLP
jgi:hypothetical protein